MRIAIALAILFCTSCRHQRAVISSDARVVISAPKIIGISEMTEDEAIQIWLRHGKYRGLTDNQWMKLMGDISVMNMLK